MAKEVVQKVVRSTYDEVGLPTFQQTRFDNSQYLSRDSNLIGVADSSQMTFVVRLSTEAAMDAVDFDIFRLRHGSSGQPNVFNISKNSSNQINLSGYSESEVLLADILSPVNTLRSASGMVTIFITIDTSGSGICYVDDIPAAMSGPVNAGNFDFSMSSVDNITLFNDHTGADTVNITVQFVWAHFGGVLDITNQNVRDLFRSPYFLSSDGSGAGLAPQIYFQGEAAGWQSGVNLGSGGDFVMNGTVS